MASNVDVDFIPNLPSGPLDEYRKKASYDWKKLKLVFEDPEMLKLKMKVWDMLQTDVLFHHLPTTLSVEQQKRRAALQLAKYHQFRFYTDEILKNNYKKKTRSMMTINEATAAVHMDLSVKFAVGVGLCTNTVLTLGTERHLPFYKAAWTGEILSCLALTEVSHGSNTKKMRTTATYDPKTREFVIHTPDFLAAKCWVGNLGKTCTHAILFAQLITADGTCHGLHVFIVPIRDPKTLLPYSGIIVGDMGEKTGLNGIDNGFILFQNYRIPRENLLNRISNVTPEGEYETFFTNPQQLLGAALENLSTGRVGIMQESANTLSNALCIAIRYSAVRRQFGPSDKDCELPIIEYQLQQWRLFPYLAAACALKVFISTFTDQYLDCVEESNSGGKLNKLSVMVAEIHAIVTSCKPLMTWTCNDAIQECREACGGNGYLRAAGLGELRNNHDAKVTYEGDNNVLVQQASNWLLRQWRLATENGTCEVASPLNSVQFLSNAESILKKKFTGTKLEDVLSHSFVSEAFQWLLCWLLKTTEEKFRRYLDQNEDRFTARNNVQVYQAKTMSLVYAENIALVYFWDKCCDPSLDPNLRPVLEHLYLLYGLWCLDKNLTILYQGSYASGPNLADLVKGGILHLCSLLKNEAVGIVDALAPPDYILNSILGTADGKVYENLQAAFFHNPGAMERPSWWSEIIPRPSCKL
ncbi:peroxisomal acyl-coenzyme A oxidase 3 [Anabrus simplex]|uniref:peroxisomal acyl-coenzyme A oxidase 3 n=1 Tax=Anabrus simplex TaxID=316456 RepID=UPI0035A2CAF9